MSHSPTVIFFIATEPEAAGLKKLLSLKRDFSYRFSALYRRERYFLIITGIGKLQAAAAVGAFLSTNNNWQDHIAFNFGIAGSGLSDDLGQLFCIDRVRDVASALEYIPDLLFPAPCPLRGLETHDRPVRNTDALIDKSSLVDMEAAGIWSAARGKLAPHRLMGCKLVSDYTDPSTLSASGIELLCSNMAPQILIDTAGVVAFLHSERSLKANEQRYIQEMCLQKDSEDYYILFETLLLLSSIEPEQRANVMKACTEEDFKRLPLHARYNRITHAVAHSTLLADLR
jgi:hypothetical protein